MIKVVSRLASEQRRTQRKERQSLRLFLSMQSFGAILHLICNEFPQSRHVGSNAEPQRASNNSRLALAPLPRSRTEDAHAREAPRRRPRTDPTAISSVQSPDPIVECRLCGSYVTGFCHRMSCIFSIYLSVHSPKLRGHVLSSFLSDLWS